jgi:hypothetical protein
MLFVDALETGTLIPALFLSLVSSVEASLNVLVYTRARFWGGILMLIGARVILCVMLFSAVGYSTQVCAQQRGPSTAEERTRAVQTAKSLQVDPLAANIQADREWLVRWLIEVPDISVKMCTTFLGDLGDSNSRYPGAVIATMLASEAAFVIEHPEKAKDVQAVYLAGVDGALTGYQAIHNKDSSYHVSHLDDLIQKRDQGKLAEYVRSVAKKCK